jgi:hypothetical protein
MITHPPDSAAQHNSNPIYGKQIHKVTVPASIYFETFAAQGWERIKDLTNI